MIHRLGAAAAVALVGAALSGCIVIASEGGERTVVTSGASAAMPTPQASFAVLYQDAVADPRRPAEEAARDPLRHPAEMLAFAQVAPGDRIADIRPGAGYFTRLFADVAGPNGHVYAFVPNRTAERENPGADALAQAYPNVSRVNGALDAMTRITMQDELARIWREQQVTMILVTHDLEEAIFLADRVLIMPREKGTPPRLIDVALPRPRDRSEPRFVDMRRRLMAEFGLH